MTLNSIDGILATVVSLQRNSTEVALFLRNVEGGDATKYIKVAGGIYILLAKHFLQTIEPSALSSVTPFLLETEPSEFAKKIYALESLRSNPKLVIRELIRHVTETLDSISGKGTDSRTINDFDADLRELLYDVDIDAFGSMFKSQ